MTPETERRNQANRNVGRPGEQLTFAALEQAKPSQAQHRPPAMFTKPPLFTGKGGPSRFDPEHDEELRGGL